MYGIQRLKSSLKYASQLVTLIAEVLISIMASTSMMLSWKRFVLITSVGGGGITDGVLIDDDFDQSGRRARSSHTRSQVDDQGVLYFNVDAGWRMFDWGLPGSTLPGYIDLFVGYQRWEEKYVGLGITGTPTALNVKP